VIGLVGSKLRSVVPAVSVQQIHGFDIYGRDFLYALLDPPCNLVTSAQLSPIALPSIVELRCAKYSFAVRKDGQARPQSCPE
jgi:hypothetical protein